MRRLSQSLHGMMSSSRDVEGETALADMVVSGRQFYEAQQYKRALEQFTRVRACEPLLCESETSSDVLIGNEILSLR